jgi:putative toxin-antitoxin system antitoxin component (TIGR02293 family)
MSNPAQLSSIQRSEALANLWRCIESGGDGQPAGVAEPGPGQADRAKVVGRARAPRVVRLDNATAHKIVQRGISSKAIGPLSEFLGLGRGAVADILELDRGTAVRRAAKDQPLPTHAAEGVLRMIELDQLATETFETVAEAAQWLRKPHPMLDGEAPLSAARTSFGAQRVRDILLAIRYGGVA